MVPSEKNLLKTDKRARAGLRRLPLLVIAAVAAAAVSVSCSQEKKRYVPNTGSGDETPTMTTNDVNTLISDSGYTRYHLVSPLWMMYEDAEEPFWRFPDGLELEQYDTEMNITANVVCDSAVYFSRKRLWQLDGNVVMVNPQADSFLTQQLFWDQNARKIYTDSFIHIVRTDRIIEGYGMESDQTMRAYTVTNPTAILPSESFRRNQADSASTSSAEKPEGAEPQSKPADKGSGDAFKATGDVTGAPAPSAGVTTQRKQQSRVKMTRQ